MSVFELEDIADYTVGGQGPGEGVDSAAVGRGVFCAEGFDEVVF